MEGHMASPGVGPNNTTQSSNPNLIEQKLRAERVVKSGASWFLMVGLLSLVNSVLSVSGSGVRFIFGLGIAQFVDAFAKQAGQVGIVPDLIINAFFAGVFVLFWNFAKKGEQWAFLVGIGLYAVDAIAMLAFHDILAVAFHGYAFWRIYRGMSGIQALKQLQSQLQPADAPIQPR
jgi:hypothetical protein